MNIDNTLLPLLYMLAALSFILAIKWMNSPATARRGVLSARSACCWPWSALCCASR